MCGIAGVLLTRDASVQPEELPRRVAAMTAMIRHRGPDRRGIYCEADIGLGHARLAVLDLSEAGDQPMRTADGRLSLVFNGEIYNFRELRRQLEGLGHAFRSQSDSEVVLQGYRAWGEGLFRRLRGMFAIAVWDAAAGTLVMARDRLGEKPLYFAEHAGLFLFGSEIKAILAWPGFPRQPNHEAIHHYLTFQYVPAPYTAFEKVHALPPATILRVSQTGVISQSRYWYLPEPAATCGAHPSELREQLLERLHEAVSLCRIADVPVGAFLSGGVDSSAVVAVMRHQTQGDIETCTVGFAESSHDERQFASDVAHRFHTNHRETVLQPPSADELQRIAWHYNQPFADSSAVATWSVARLARERVIVALTGDGGDEAFAGYARYGHCRVRHPAERLPRWFQRWAGQIGHMIPAEATRYRTWRGIKRRLLRMSQRRVHRYAEWISYFSDDHKALAYDRVMRPFLRASSLDLISPYFGPTQSLLESAVRTDIHSYLPDDLLVKVDVATMAHGLEARAPFLDHELVEWAARLPLDIRSPAGRPKALLVDTFASLLPPETYSRPKAGFGVPIEHWLRTGLKTIAYDLLLDDTAAARGIVQPAFVRKMLSDHCSGAVPHHPRLWALLMLELWYRSWIDPPSLPPPPEPV